MGLMEAFAAAWRKNSPELFGVWDESLPKFLTASSPPDQCGGVPVFSYHMVQAAELEADLAFLKTNGYRTLGIDTGAAGQSTGWLSVLRQPIE